MPTALVTGATGFIGGHLVKALSSCGWDVHATIRDNTPPAVTAHRLDGTQACLNDILATVRPDVVFHLASLFLADHRADQVEPLAAANIVFPMQLVEAMVQADCHKLVNTGTAWQFDSQGAVAPVNLYAATKQAFEAILPYYRDARGLSTISLRLFDTYGPSDPRRKLIRILLDAATIGERLDMSPGEQIVDLTHIDDVVSAFLGAGQRLLDSNEPLDEEFFVSGERQSVKALVEIVGEALRKPISVHFGGRPYRPREVMLPVEPGQRIMPGWQRRRSLVEALPAMVSL
ncbi:hypothetical protein NS355_09565 [Sphingomonas yabuuchiae]|uniref:NAD-dependent epimerase/dehydratase domain-containing protein n=1 Tax=Sphingomonas yabuuchiae TaxID=172044 RepID=A0A147ISS9_9SPHN|nr:NAD-dependent epimerase/dehydratase family protein [Sphingomonas yabuuchiae]KTT98270.1 hypothetical protein NS355_09565 [Sphingomonas yabuuchiae]